MYQSVSLFLFVRKGFGEPQQQIQIWVHAFFMPIYERKQPKTNKAMDFKDAMKQLSERIDRIKENLQTEEATKTAFVMPFLQILGYDVFNPMEVMPEFTCDIGTKKGEKVDYAILKDGKPVILIEAKHWAEDLNRHDDQLIRYFHASNAKFGILTNGILYRFYTDLDNPNKMDEKPFLEMNLSDLRNHQIEELKKFHKTYFDLDNILSSASELKYTGELKGIISREFAGPSSDFVRLFARQVYGGSVTAKVLDQFTELVRKSISSHISDIISERLKTALKTEAAQQPVAAQKENEQETASNDSVVTTVEELEAFYIVKSILRYVISAERIGYRDAQTYFTILIDDNNRKRVCRLYLSSTNKYIGLDGESKPDSKGRMRVEEIKHKIEAIDEIYSFSEQLLAAVKDYV